MSATRVKRTGIVFASLLVGGIGICRMSDHSLTAAPQPDKDSAIKELRKEKLETAKLMLDTARAARQAGRATTVQVYEATLVANNAELELCDTNAERVNVLERMLETTKQKEETIRALVAKGDLSTSDRLTARMLVLDAQIALEQAKGQ